MAFSYSGQKKFAEAEREFQTALRLDPQYDAAATDYVALLFGTNQQPKALDFAKQYAATNGSRVQPHYIYANALANSKNLDQAAVEFQKCVDLDPKFMGPYVQLSRIYLGQNKPDQAIATLQKALSVDPNSAGINLSMGEIYLSRNDLKSARTYFEKANQIAPADALVANDLAWTYAQQGENLDVALNLAQLAKQTMPDVPAVTDTLAWVQYKKGNYSIAVGLLDEAVKKYPQNPQYRYHLGMALSAAGDNGRAKAELQKALELNLHGDDAKQAQLTLAKL
jgi:tetratricopeptide (TPR) repeat protein